MRRTPLRFRERVVRAFEVPPLEFVDSHLDVRDVLAPRLHALHEDIRASWAWRYGRLLKAEAKRLVGPALQRLKARVLALLSGGPGRA